MKAKGLIYKGNGRQAWRWNIAGRNGEIQAQGEGHPNERKALIALKRAVWNTVCGSGKGEGLVCEFTIKLDPRIPGTIVLWTTRPFSQ